MIYPNSYLLTQFSTDPIMFYLQAIGGNGKPCGETLIVELPALMWKIRELKERNSYGVSKSTDGEPKQSAG